MYGINTGFVPQGPVEYHKVMSDRIVFEEDDAGLASLPARARQPRGLPARLVVWGIVPNEETANYLLVGVSIVCFAAMVFILMRGLSSPGASYGNYDQVRVQNPDLFQNNPPPAR